MSSFLMSTTAPQAAVIPIITVGMAVQMISSRVWPWIGGPSDSSPSGARNFQTE